MNQSTLYCIIIFTLLWIAAMLEVSGQENGISTLASLSLNEISLRQKAILILLT